ncbi:MAG TPA: Crp/Fnr family transcriptional regulator [Burkholderiales bacterium]|nr:Crp/Fnr family transcriptional regulator [Burkholderiales bacterium]
MPPANGLLAAIPARQRAGLARRLETVALTFGDVLYDGKPIRNVYFPLDCVVSLLAPLKDHLAVEVGMVGNEGVVGVSLALGVRTSSVEAIVQGSGTALRMEASAFLRELKRSTALRTGVLRYIHLLMGQLTQTAACNALHSIEARCARWLLMTRDRMQSDEVELTHEFLACMLGVRRVGVTVAAGNLQRQGLIAYSRGHIAILDPERLAASACECYSVVKTLYKRDHRNSVRSS